MRMRMDGVDTAGSVEVGGDCAGTTGKVMSRLEMVGLPTGAGRPPWGCGAVAGRGLLVNHRPHLARCG